jgi:peptidoglycan/LPS O-acetylase OafA/YrhL
MLVVLGAAEAGRQDLLRVPASLQMIGSASYSIDLFQCIFMGLAWKVLQFTQLVPRVPVLLTFAVLTLSSVGGAIVVSRTVELPLIQLLRGFSGRPPRSAKPQVVS